jgi:predicted Zn-dependent peptidase
VTDRFERTELDGLVALTERIPGLHSITTGVWVRSGSVDEVPAEMGISHLLEHMVFKGTASRSARDIALDIERVGGSLDAYTTREHTSFQARVLDEFADLSIDVLADLVLHPLLRPEDLELEREVVLEEIATVEDTPDDLVFELHSARLWGGHPYGFSVLGTRETVGSATTDALRRRHEARYRRDNMVIAAVGNVDHAWFVDRVTALFGRAGRGGRNGGPPMAPAHEPVRQSIARETAQTHIVAGTRTFEHADPRRYAFVLLSAAVGGGMSSRLFQRIREELGLAYAVFTFQSFYRSGGVSGVYVGTRPESADRALAEVEEALARVAAEGLTAAELADVKGQVKGQIALSMESTGARLHRLAGTELFDEPFRTVEQVIERVDAVTLEEVAELAAEYFAPDRQTVTRLGPAA